MITLKEYLEENNEDKINMMDYYLYDSYWKKYYHAFFTSSGIIKFYTVLTDKTTVLNSTGIGTETSTLHIKDIIQYLSDYDLGVESFYIVPKVKITGNLYIPKVDEKHKLTTYKTKETLIDITKLTFHHKIDVRDNTLNQGCKIIQFNHKEYALVSLKECCGYYGFNLSNDSVKITEERGSGKLTVQEIEKIFDNKIDSWYVVVEK